MPKKANGMTSRPRITVAIQPEVLSRSFCSIGRARLGEAAQFNRIARAAEAAGSCRQDPLQAAPKEKAPLPALLSE